MKKQTGFSVLLGALLIMASCGSPDKIEQTGKGKWTSIVGRGLDEIDKELPVNGAIEALDYSTNTTKSVAGIKNALQTLDAQMFYYYGHSSGASVSSDASYDISQIIEWRGMKIGSNVLSPTDIPQPKSIYSFIFMNCCWSVNGPVKEALITKLRPATDASGKAVKTPYSMVGWAYGIGAEAAGDFAVKFFEQAKTGLSVARACTEADESSRRAFRFIWKPGSILIPGAFEEFHAAKFEPLQAANDMKLVGPTP